MIFGNRKTIGVFMNKTDAYFDNIVHGVIQEEAKKLDYDVFVFSTVGYHQSNNDYDTQEKGMFPFAPVEQLDGIMVVPDSYEMHGFRDYLMDMLRKRAKGPIVSIRYHQTDNDCVFTDETVAIRPLVRHLIEDHGLKRICFLAGYPGHTDSELRLQCYRDEMAQHGLELPDHAICYGSMWLSDGPKAYDHYFVQHDVKPEAIVCANDYMAQGLIEELKKHGIRVPEDLIVTGFDNITGIGTSMITITTIAQDYAEMVRKGMKQLDKRIRAKRADDIKEGPQLIGLPGKLVLGESCGCRKPDFELIAKAGRENAMDVEVLKNREISMTYLTIELGGCDDLKELHDVIIRKKDDVQMMRDFYLCLFEKDNTGSGKREFAEEITDNACLVMAMRDRQDNGMPMITFDRRSLLPPMAERPDEAQVFFVMLLHQQESTFGYSLIRYTDGAIPTPFYQHWNVIVAGALRNMHNRNILQTLYEERRLSSITDMMTHLYNRRGLEEQINPMWTHLCTQREMVAFIYFDMDHLKEINDTYGHSAGDYAIRTVSKAIQQASPKGAIVARMGGDEFLVFLPRASQQVADNYMLRFDDVLMRINDEAKRTFRVESSCGAYVTRLDDDSTLEQCIHESDQIMYEEKQKRHAARKI